MAWPLGGGATGVAQTGVGLGIQTHAGLNITGAVGTVYSVQYVTDLGQTNEWRCLTFLQLPATNYLWFDPIAPATGIALDPQGPPTGSSRVVRGGDWNIPSWSCRSARRSRLVCDPVCNGLYIGFRVLLLAPVQP